MPRVSARIIFWKKLLLLIIVCHHLNKAHRERSEWHALRGSTAIAAWADGLISLRPAADEPDAPRRITVWHRDEASPEPGGFELRFDPASGRNGVPAAMLTPCEAPALGKTARTTAKNNRRTWIVRNVRSAPGAHTVKTLTLAVPVAMKVDERTIRRDIEDMEAEGLIYRNEQSSRIFPVGVRDDDE